ncbi:MAG: hypothetical protein HUU37_09880 [Bdellovibrionales bacterium]|nr:hypothetical protein [Bdellovibrionales bacterium]
MNCSISTEPGHAYGSQMKLVAGMITEVPLKRENVKARFQFNDLHDYVKLEAWNQTTGTVAVTEVYAISVAKKVVLTSYQSKPGSLNFHFRCDVE